MSDKSTFEQWLDSLTLSDEEVSALEQRVIDSPSEAEARISLLGYYTNQAYRKQEFKSKRIVLLTWFVDNKPGHEVLGLIHGLLRDSYGREAYADLRQRCSTYLDQEGIDLNILKNVAKLFSHDDKHLAERCLLLGKLRDPDNAKWSHNLSSLYDLWGTGYEMKAFAECKEALRLSADTSDEFYEFTRVPELAYRAEQFDEAVSSATELLRMRDHHKHFDGGHSNEAHTVLGLVALTHNDREGAVYHLLESAKEAASPKTTSFGPHLQLAAELLALGETDAVLRYWNDCEAFWSSGKLQLKRWREQLHEGRNPLYYLPTNPVEYREVGDGFFGG